MSTDSPSYSGEGKSGQCNESSAQKERKGKEK